MNRPFESLDEALQGSTAPDEIRNSLALIQVPYLSFNSEIRKGQLIVHKELAEEVRELFESLVTMGFPVAQIEPLQTYNWSDEASMTANNTSAFNYRQILETDRLSNHSFGRAIDINPVQNPYYSYSGKTYPPNATYNPVVPGTIIKDGPVVALFKSKGWYWDGNSGPGLDYQHFQKIEP